MINYLFVSKESRNNFIYTSTYKGDLLNVIEDSDYYIRFPISFVNVLLLAILCRGVE